MAKAKVSAADVKALRERTGAPMMDTKAALEEAGGDMDKAVELLRVKGAASAEKRSGRGTGEGIVASYTHATGKVGTLVQVECETDFVARNEDFQDFAREVAIHVAAIKGVSYVTADEIPEEVIEAERRVHSAKAKEEGKPDDVVEKIVEGQVSKFAKESALLEQEHFNAEKHDGKTIDEMRTELAAKTGENIRIARIARFEIGEED
jgi:elongation factor Ts